MAKRKKQEIKYVCEKCGKEPQRDEKQSNENWNVYKIEPCKYCGGKLTFTIKTE